MLEKLVETRKSPVHNRFLNFFAKRFPRCWKTFFQNVFHGFPRSFPPEKPRNAWVFLIFHILRRWISLVFHNGAHLALNCAVERAATAPRQFSAVGKLVVFRSIFHSWRIRRELKPIYSVENISEPTSSVFSPENAVFFRKCFMNCVKRGFTSDFATLYLYGYSLRNTCCNNVKGSRNEAHLSAE